LITSLVRWSPARHACYQAKEFGSVARSHPAAIFKAHRSVDCSVWCHHVVGNLFEKLRAATKIIVIGATVLILPSPISIPIAFFNADRAAYIAASPRVAAQVRSPGPIPQIDSVAGDVE
jgi:hypothetical protein